MAEIDPVILQLRADVAKYNADMQQTARRVTEHLGRQEASIIHLESQMRKSSGAISNSIKSLGGSIGAYLSVGELAKFSDGFTRLQNNLRVAGLEGDALKEVQDRLFQSAQKYGVEIEGLSNLYGQLTQASKELGASQGQIFGITDAVSASLKITGLSSQEASGALLQLTQSLRGGKVQAEEYNSLLDGLYPLLEAAANGSSRFGGSVAKLTAQVKDGKVSSQDFFNAILAGSDVLEGKAAKASLTLSAGYTTLNNALTVYFGEADKANGVSAALGEAMGVLADNLDTLIPAITAISIGLGVRYVAAAGAAAVSSLAAASAAGTLNASLLAAFGNPIILAIGAVAAGIAYLALRSDEASSSTKALSDQQKALNSLMAADKTDSIAGSTSKLTSARAQLTRETFALAKAEAYLRAQQAEKALNLAKRGVKEVQDTGYEVVPGSRQRRPVTTTREVALGDRRARGGDGLTEKDRALKVATDEMVAAGRAVLAVRKAEPIAGTATGGVPNAATGGKKDKPKKSASGPTADEITAKYSADLRQIVGRDLQSRLSMAVNADDRAELENRLLNDEIRSAQDDIKANKDYSDARKKKLLAELASYEVTERGRIEMERQEQAARDASDVAQSGRKNDRDMLEAQARLTDSRIERRDLELRLLDLAYEQEKADLDGVIASKTSRYAQKQIAAQRLAVLGQLKGRDTDAINRDAESPLEQRRREVNKTAANMGDAVENIQMDALDRLTDGLADASTEYIKLGGIAGEVINGIIRDMVRLAAQQAIFGKAGGGGGILGSIGGLLGIGGGVTGVSAASQSYLDNYKFQGFASGGYTGDGSRDEVAGVVHKGEYVIPANAVKRIGVESLAAIAAGDTSAARSMTGVSAAGTNPRPVQQTIVVKVDPGQYFDARVDQRASNIAIPVATASGVQARSAATGDVARAQRRRIP